MQAQQPVVGGGPPVGSVAVHVTCGDTQKPARFAHVMLQSVVAANSNEDLRSQNVNGSTDAEGNFTAVNVGPGDYYVMATAPGYIPERALLQAKLSAGATPAALLAEIPVVRVTAYGTASIVVTMERGATIAGRVQWEDGSPALVQNVRVVSSTEINGPLPGGLQGIQSGGPLPNTGMTDDRGAFRVSGLAAGDYLVATQIQPPAQYGGAARTESFNSAITIYSPGVFRRSEAKVVTVNPGEERSDVLLVINVRGLHTVSGHLTSSDPGLSVASGMVRLIDANDNSINPMTVVSPSGDFVMRYVPPGTYTLRVSGASTAARSRGNQGTHVSFQSASQAVTVTDGDVADVAVTLTPAP
jgi:hypothetical protein